MQDLRKKCLAEAKKAVAESVNPDNFIIQAISNIGELDKTSNALSSRLREWYGLYFPELERHVHDNEAFARLVLKDKEELMKEFNLKESMGGKLEEDDLVPILEYASTVKQIHKLRDNIETYLENVMKKYCRNLLAVAGITIGGKLLAEVGSLKRIATLPSTSIQMLGAEKALFRHLKTGAKPPRHGHIFAHPLVQKAKDKDRGKVSRALADKLALAARADFFGKNFIGGSLRAELEKRFS